VFASQVAKRWRACRPYRSHEAEETRHGAAVIGRRAIPKRKSAWSKMR
jgi:hypothetical protein